MDTSSPFSDFRVKLDNARNAVLSLQRRFTIRLDDPDLNEIITGLAVGQKSLENCEELTVERYKEIVKETNAHIMEQLQPELDKFNKALESIDRKENQKKRKRKEPCLEG